MALQFPEGLLLYACVIADILEGWVWQAGRLPAWNAAERLRPRLVMWHATRMLVTWHATPAADVLLRQQWARLWRWQMCKCSAGGFRGRS